jgi:hypothetical protein
LSTSRGWVAFSWDHELALRTIIHAEYSVAS